MTKLTATSNEVPVFGRRVSGSAEPVRLSTVGLDWTRYGLFANQLHLRSIATGRDVRGVNSHPFETKIAAVIHVKSAGAINPIQKRL